MLFENYSMLERKEEGMKEERKIGKTKGRLENRNEIKERRRGGRKGE